MVAVAVLLANPAHGQSNRPEISFSVTRDGEFLLTNARVDLAVTPSLAWAVLTDYESYPRFISNMRESRIVSRSPEGLVVEQKGSFSLLFFSQEIEVRILVSEHQPNIIESRAIAGDFRVMTGRYELLPVENGVRLTFSGRLVSNFYLPPVFGVNIARHVLLMNFRQMVDEILRRDAAVRRSEHAEAPSSKLVAHKAGMRPH